MDIDVRLKKEKSHKDNNFIYQNAYNNRNRYNNKIFTIENDSINENLQEEQNYVKGNYFYNKYSRKNYTNHNYHYNKPYQYTIE